MSKRGREQALDIIQRVIKDIDQNYDTRAYASTILNRLLKGGFLNENATVHVDEVKDELNNAVFRCCAGDEE